MGVNDNLGQVLACSSLFDATTPCMHALHLMSEHVCESVCLYGNPQRDCSVENRHCFGQPAEQQLQQAGLAHTPLACVVRYDIF